MFSKKSEIDEPAGEIPPVSMYSDITDEALEAIHAQYTAKYGIALNDETKSLGERRLEMLVKDKVKPEKEKEEIHTVQEFVKEYVYRQLKEFAMIIFLFMKKSGDYGDMGEDRVAISFMRNILYIPNNTQVEQFQVFQFNRIIDECDKRHGQKSADEYMKFIKNWQLALFNKTYPYHSITDIIPVFDLIKAPYMLCGTSDSYGIQFILAECEAMEYDKYTAYMLRREYIRSPQRVLSAVATPYRGGALVRREAFEVIAFNKYQTYLKDYGKYNFFGMEEHINNVIGDALKKRVFSGFGIDLDSTTPVEKKEKYEKIKDSIIAEMEDGVLWNQIGSIVYKENLDPIYVAFRSCLVYDTDGISTIYGSVLYDWLPRKGRIQGAMSRFCEIAEFDPARAERDVYMYLSDNWFTDEDDFMIRTTNISTGLVIPFLNKDASVDFFNMKKEIPVIYDLALNRLKALYDKLIAIIHKSHYQCGIYKMDYARMEDQLFRMYSNTRNARSLEELRIYSSFWVNMHGYLKKFSPEGYEEFQAVLAVEALEFETAVLDYITGGNADKYRSLRAYFFFHFLKIGLIPNTWDYSSYIMNVNADDEYTLAYNRGIVCQYNGETKEALKYFDEALQEKSRSAQALYKRGLINKELKNTKAAFADLKAAGEISFRENDAFSVVCFTELGNLCVETGDKKGAIENYTKAIEQDSKNKDTLLKRGDVYSEIGDYVSAINDYSNVIKINANCIEAFEKRAAAYEKEGRREESSKDYAFAACYNGQIFYEQKDYEKAIEEFLKSLSFQNDFEGALLYLAFSYHNKGEHEKALDAYAKIIEIAPNNYNAWVNRGNINRDYKKDIDAALNDYNKAIALRSDLPNAFENRGILLHNQGKYSEAIDDFSSAIKIKPDALFFYRRGLTYGCISDRENAIKDYTAAIKNKPDYYDAYLKRGLAYESYGSDIIQFGEFDKKIFNERQNNAVTDLTRLAELAPNDARSYFYRARTYHGDARKAIEDLNIAIEKNPEYYDAWLERANMKRYLVNPNSGVSKDYEEALHDYDEAIRLNPKNVDALCSKARVYLEDIKDFEKAAQTYSEAIQITPYYDHIKEKHAYCLIKAGQYDNAIKSCRDSVIYLFNAYTHPILGEEEFLSGKYEEALSIYEKEIKNNPGNAYAVFLLSLTLIMLERYDAAESVLSDIQWTNSNDVYYAKAYLSCMWYAAVSKTIDDLTKVIKNAPDDINAYIERGKAYHDLFRSDIVLIFSIGTENEAAKAGAVENYKSALKIQPGNEQLWFGLGKFYDVYYDTHQKTIFLDRAGVEEFYLNPAVENYTKALQLKPDFVEALECRAKVYEKLGLDKKAKADYKTAIEAVKNKTL